MQGSILESSAGARIKARVARRNSSNSKPFHFNFDFDMSGSLNELSLIKKNIHRMKQFQSTQWVYRIFFSLPKDMDWNYQNIGLLKKLKQRSRWGQFTERLKEVATHKKTSGGGRWPGGLPIGWLALLGLWCQFYKLNLASYLA